MIEKSNKRVLLKLSGEQFAGDDRSCGVSPKFCRWLAKEIMKLTNQKIQVVIIVGGGNFVRGAHFAKHGIDRTAADYMGMLGTIINGLALMDMLEQEHQPARLTTRLRADSVAEPFIPRKVMQHLEKGRVVIIAGGTGNPYVTTDTAAVLAASELNCDFILKGTKVDGVYDKDPVEYKDAKRFDQLSLADSLALPDVKVMDKTALAMAAEQNIPIVVFDVLKDGNILAATEKKIGTTIC